MAAPQTRLRSLDIIRGAVMVLMALDHVRVFAGVPAGGSTPAIFFTRWVTHFCAPAFVFLAGTGAFLHGGKLHDPRELSKYLLVRGALLVGLELTICRFSWTFNFDFYNYNDANILWAIGWSMITLAALIHLPLQAIGAFALIIIAGHNVTDFFQQQLDTVLRGSPFAHLLQILYFGGEFRWFDTGPTFVVLYSIIPWVGVIAAGYLFGAVMIQDAPKRRTLCLSIGLGSVVAFLVLRGFNIYGNPWPWSAEGGGGGGAVKALLSFLNTNKYPASLQFLLMTLGPTIALVPVLEHAEGWLLSRLITFGRVPLFFYLLHIPFIHATTVLISLVRTPAATWWLFANHPLRVPPPPPGYRYSLLLLYAVWLFVVCVLYVPCRQYAKVKAERRHPWLAYF